MPDRTKGKRANMGKTIVGMTLAALLLAGCDTPGKTVGLGAGLGAAGALELNANPLTGAAIGAGAGAVCELVNGCN